MGGGGGVLSSADLQTVSCVIFKSMNKTCSYREFNLCETLKFSALDIIFYCPA